VAAKSYLANVSGFIFTPSPNESPLRPGGRGSEKDNTNHNNYHTQKNKHKNKREKTHKGPNAQLGHVICAGQELESGLIIIIPSVQSIGQVVRNSFDDGGPF